MDPLVPSSGLGPPTPPPALPTPPSLPPPSPSIPIHPPILSDSPSPNNPILNLPIPENKITGTSDHCMQIDDTTGKTNSREAATLLPYQPPSPQRKKAKIVKRKITLERKPLLDLEEDNWARFFVVKKKDGSFSKDCPFELESFLRKNIGKVKNARKQNDGTLCIEADNQAQANTILGLSKVTEAEVEVGPHRRLNTSQGVVSCPDLLNSKLEAIKEGLASEGVVDVRRIKRRQGDTLVDTASLVLTFDRPRPPTSIKAAFYRLLVRPYIPSPMRCFKCQKYGHTAQRCKAEQAVCVCGKPSHEGDCVPPPTCVNCGGGHNARAPACPVLQEEKEVQKVKTLENISYKEAREKVRSRSYVKPTFSYAEKAKMFQATPANSESAPSPVLREFVERFNIKTPTKINDASGSQEPQAPFLAISKGQVVGIDPPQSNDASEGAWTVVTPKGSPKKVSSSFLKKNISAIHKVVEIKRNLTASDFLKVTGKASPQGDAVGTGSRSQSLEKRKKGWQKGRPRKNSQ